MKLEDLKNPEIRKAFTDSKFAEGNGGGVGRSSESSKNSNKIDIAKEKFTRAQEFFSEAYSYLLNSLGGHRLGTPDTRPKRKEAKVSKLNFLMQRSRVKSKDVSVGFDSTGGDEATEPPLSKIELNNQKVLSGVLERTLKRLAEYFEQKERGGGKVQFTRHEVESSGLEILGKEWEKIRADKPSKEVEDYLGEAIGFAFTKLVPEQEISYKSLDVKSADRQALRNSPKYKELVNEVLTSVQGELSNRRGAEEKFTQAFYHLFGEQPEPSEVDVFLDDLQQTMAHLQKGKKFDSSELLSAREADKKVIEQLRSELQQFQREPQQATPTTMPKQVSDSNEQPPKNRDEQVHTTFEINLGTAELLQQFFDKIMAEGHADIRHGFTFTKHRAGLLQAYKNKFGMGILEDDLINLTNEFHNYRNRLRKTMTPKATTSEVKTSVAEKTPVLKKVDEKNAADQLAIEPIVPSQPEVKALEFADKYGIEFTRQLTSEEQSYVVMLIKTGLEYFESQKDEWLKSHSPYMRDLLAQNRDAFQEYVSEAMRLWLPRYYTNINLPVREQK